MLKATILVTVFSAVMTVLQNVSPDSTAKIIMNTVGTLGFPIVVCLILMGYIKENTANYRNDISKLNVMHSEEVSEIKEAINNNTLALQKLYDKLSESEDKPSE